MTNQPGFLRIYNGWNGQSIFVQIRVIELLSGAILGDAERSIVRKYTLAQLVNGNRGLFYIYILSLYGTPHNEIRGERQEKS